MNILERLGALVGRQTVSDELKDIFTTAGTTKELLRSLGLVLTKNERELAQLREEIAKVDAMVDEESEKVRVGVVVARQKRYTLQHINRLRAHIDNLDDRMGIYDRNLHLHIHLIGKIQDMEAMALCGATEKQIESVILDFEESLESYSDTIQTGKREKKQTKAPDLDLEKLERELMAPPTPEEKEEEEEEAQEVVELE